MSSFVQGERFFIPLDEEDPEPKPDTIPSEDSPPKPQDDSSAPLTGLVVADVLERTGTSKPKPPAPPTFKPGSVGGFPQHRKLGAARVSRFKAGRQAPAAETKLTESAPSKPRSEKETISEENNARLANMSLDEIQEAQEEIRSAIDPALLARLMKRRGPWLNGESGKQESKSVVGSQAEETEAASAPQEHMPVTGLIDGPGASTGDSSIEGAKPAEKQETDGPSDSKETPPDVPAQSKPTKTVSFDIPESLDDKPEIQDSENVTHNPLASIHFPRPPAPPKLDPSSPNFLADLQSHYFPSLTHDPTKTEWMSHVTSPPRESLPTSIPVSGLRFDMNGRILGPSAQENLPTNLGLHHHGDEPDKAGYTVSELTTLARSIYPPQRCIAIIVLGRVLWRLGMNEFGKLHEVEDKDGNIVPTGPASAPSAQEEELAELAHALERHLEQERVVDILLEEVRLEGRRHASAKAYAEEAVWLWRKAGAPAWTEESASGEAKESA